MKSSYMLYKLLIWLRDTKRLNITDYCLIDGISRLEAKSGKVTKWDICQLGIIKGLTHNNMRINRLVSKGYVSIGDQKNPFKSANLSLTLKGKILINYGNKILEGLL